VSKVSTIQKSVYGEENEEDNEDEDEDRNRDMDRDENEDRDGEEEGNDDTGSGKCNGGKVNSWCWETNMNMHSSITYPNYKEKRSPS
jgi:hypothetical protein